MQGTEGTQLVEGNEGSLPTDGERLTTVGLLFESAIGLRRIFQQRFDSERSLANQSFDVLIRLARSPGSELRMSELVAQTSLTPSGLTRSVDRLVEQELVTRRVCPEDRRGAFAVLTPAGRELMDRVIPEHVAHVEELLDSLFTAEEEQTLALLLRRLRDHVYADRSEWGLACDEAADECLGDG
jgi:MarR family transcriptional regulator, 2-MHQ and catechol-resistance regulon repressor